MATNDFLVFGGDGAANVISQASYAALTARLAGFQSGVAQSGQLNKVWRQASIISAVLGQFISDQSGQNAVDDGTTATLVANLVAAVRGVGKTAIILNDAGVANAYAAVNAPALSGGTWIDGVVQRVKIANANTGASTYSPDGLPGIPIFGMGLSTLQGGELRANGVATLMRTTIPGVNGGSPICVLLSCYGGAQQVPTATQAGHAINLGMFTGSNQLLSGNGFQRLPGGLLIVQGQVAASSSGTAVTFPLAFDDANYRIAHGVVNSATASQIIAAGGRSATGFSMYATSSATVDYIVVGKRTS